jgi:hypothetical protein
VGGQHWVAVCLQCRCSMLTAGSRQATGCVGIAGWGRSLPVSSMQLEHLQAEGLEFSWPLLSAWACLAVCMALHKHGYFVGCGVCFGGSLQGVSPEASCNSDALQSFIQRCACVWVWVMCSLYRNGYARFKVLCVSQHTPSTPVCVCCSKVTTTRALCSLTSIHIGHMHVTSPQQNQPSATFVGRQSVGLCCVVGSYCCCSAGSPCFHHSATPSSSPTALPGVPM